MRFRMFDLNGPLPFMQGYAIKEIAQQTTGRLVAAGEVDENPQLPGTLLYVKKTYKKGEVKQSESVWHDDGTRLSCLYKRINNEPWEQRTELGWQPTEFTLEAAWEFRLPEPIGKHTHFTWGPVVKVHSIGRIHIVEYHPPIFENCCGTGEYEKEKVEFHHYVDGEDGGTSCNTLERSLLCALDHAQNGRSMFQAAHYAAKLLNMLPD